MDYILYCGDPNGLGTDKLSPSARAKIAKRYLHTCYLDGEDKAHTDNHYRIVDKLRKNLSTRYFPIFSIVESIYRLDTFGYNRTMYVETEVQKQRQLSDLVKIIHACITENMIVPYISFSIDKTEEIKGLEQLLSDFKEYLDLQSNLILLEKPIIKKVEPEAPKAPKKPTTTPEAPKVKTDWEIITSAAIFVYDYIIKPSVTVYQYTVEPPLLLALDYVINPLGLCAYKYLFKPPALLIYNYVAKPAFMTISNWVFGSKKAIAPTPAEPKIEKPEVVKVQVTKPTVITQEEKLITRIIKVKQRIYNNELYCKVTGVDSMYEAATRIGYVISNPEAGPLPLEIKLLILEFAHEDCQAFQEAIKQDVNGSGHVDRLIQEKAYNNLLKELPRRAYA